MKFTHVVLISPVSVQSKWEDMKTNYGVPIAENISFCSLRGIKNVQPKHGLLWRHDYIVRIEKDETVNEIQKSEFRATAKFRRFLTDGVLLIVDEMQHLKNVTAQYAACQALIRAIVDACEAGGRSQMLVLSGSPIDKEEHASTLFRTLDIMKRNELCRFNVGTRILECTGIMDVVEYCKGLDAVTTNNLVESSRYCFNSEYHMRRLCYTLFQKVLKPCVSSAMPPTQLAGTLRKLNSFYDIKDESDKVELSAGVRALENAVSYDRVTGKLSYENCQSFGKVTLALVRIEKAKLNTFIRIARNALMEDASRKIVVCLNYSRSIQVIKEALAWWNPLILDGSVAKQQRKTIIDTFQTPSTFRRVLVANCSVCSTGIDLDDKHGDFPRLALVSPDYGTITLYQLCHRFQRLDTKSDAEVHMLYAKHCDELPVLSALARKGGVMKETTTEQAEAGVLFPREFPTWEEASGFAPEPNELVENFMRDRAYRRISRAVRDYLYRPNGPWYRRVKARFTFE
jgi:hypothetical protein